MPTTKKMSTCLPRKDGSKPGKSELRMVPHQRENRGTHTDLSFQSGTGGRGRRIAKNFAPAFCFEKNPILRETYWKISERREEDKLKRIKSQPTPLPVQEDKASCYPGKASSDFVWQGRGVANLDSEKTLLSAHAHCCCSIGSENPSEILGTAHRLDSRSKENFVHTLKEDHWKTAKRMTRNQDHTGQRPVS